MRASHGKRTGSWISDGVREDTFLLGCGLAPRSPHSNGRLSLDSNGARRTCSQGEGFQYVGSSSDSAVEHYFDIRAGVYHVGKHIQRRYGAIELASPVIGNDDPVSAGISCGACIGSVDYAVHYQRAAPLTTDLREVLPVEVAPVGKVALHVRRQDRSAPGRVVVLKVRHTMKRNRACERPDQPARVCKPLPSKPDTGAQRRREPGTDVVLPVRRYRRIDSDDQRTALRSLHAQSTQWSWKMRSRSGLEVLQRQNIFKHDDRRDSCGQGRGFSASSKLFVACQFCRMSVRAWRACFLDALEQHPKC